MAPAVVQATTKARQFNVSSFSFNFSSGTTAGNTLFAVGWVWRQSGAGDPHPITVSDPVNGSYTVKEGPLVSSFGRPFVAYFYNAAAVASSQLVTVGGPSNCIFEFCLIEVSGLGTVDPFDQTQTATGNSTTPDTGNTPTTTVADEILFASMLVNGSDQGSITIGGSGWTDRVEELDNTIWQSGEGDSKIVASTGTYNATWTVASGAPWGCIICTFGNTPGGAAAGQPYDLRVEGSVPRVGGIVNAHMR